jgi:flagellar L-ring protein precursor FlgH
MNKPFRTTLAASLLVLTAFSSAACGGSIWAKRSRNSKPLYADDKANQVGDILTIVIFEDHKVDNKVERDLERTSNRNLGFGDKDISIGPVLPSVSDVNIDLSSEKSLAGKSDYKDERSIEDRITVVVEDIHPNGNLVVIGTRSREVNGDKQIIQVSGIVRPSDISFDNAIRSEQVANFQMVAISEGVTKDFNDPGWLGGFLDAIWPF